MSSKQDQLIQILQPVVEGMGFIFWGLEYLSQGRHTTLRIYIDHEDGINVDQCADVSRQISAVMDVEDPISSNYTLEVSSPGVDRLLFTPEQFTLYRGYLVEMKLRSPFEGRRNFKGQLNGLEDNDVLLIVDDEEFLLPFELIEKTRLVPQFDDN